MIRIAWRLQRNGVIGVTIFGAVYGLLQASAYVSAAGSTAAARISFGREMETFGRTFTFLLPVPLHLDTASGYTQWRIYGGLVALLAIWALMSAGGATRADEDRGLVEGWLSAGVGRTRYLWVRFAVFALSAAIAISASSAAITIVMHGGGFALDSAKVAQESAVLFAVTLSCYGLVLALAQLPGRRATATGISGTVLAAIFLLNGLGRTDEQLRPIARLVSPFYWADRSTPLTPGGDFNVPATAGLLVAAFALAALAAWLMSVRDIGAPLLRIQERTRPAAHLPSGVRWLRVPVLSSLYERRVSLLAWIGGAAVGGAYMASIGRNLVDLAKAPGSFHAYLTIAGHGDPYVALTGYFWFGIFQFVLVGFALTTVSRWSSDDNEGRLEMELSAPVSRSRVVLERATSFLIAAAVVIAVGSVAFFISARAGGIDMHLGDLAVAAVALLPFVLSFAALGAVLTSRVPRAALAVLAAIAFAGYLITEGAPLLKWPTWVTKLSAFSLYGMPLTSGIDWNGMWVLLAITAGGFGLATAMMQRREVGR